MYKTLTIEICADFTNTSISMESQNKSGNFFSKVVEQTDIILVRDEYFESIAL